MDGALAGHSPPEDLNTHPSRWSVSRVLEFIAGLGLEHLKPAFSKNVVDGEQLLDLSFQDLREDLEIESPDEIYKILGAINYLRMNFNRKPKKDDSPNAVEEEDEPDDDVDSHNTPIAAVANIGYHQPNGRHHGPAVASSPHAVPHPQQHTHTMSMPHPHQPHPQPQYVVTQSAVPISHVHPGHPHAYGPVAHPSMHPMYPMHHPSPVAQPYYMPYVHPLSIGLSPYAYGRVPVTIAALPDQAGMPWTVKARVLHKGDIVHWSANTHFFTLDLQDHTLSIRAMLVNEVADKFFPLVEVGKAYSIFSGGSTVKRAAHRYPHLSSEYEINLAIDAEFNPDDEAQDASEQSGPLNAPVGPSNGPLPLPLPSSHSHSLSHSHSHSHSHTHTHTHARSHPHSRSQVAHITHHQPDPSQQPDWPVPLADLPPSSDSLTASNPESSLPSSSVSISSQDPLPPLTDSSIIPNSPLISMNGNGPLGAPPLSLSSPSLAMAVPGSDPPPVSVPPMALPSSGDAPLSPTEALNNDSHPMLQIGSTSVPLPVPSLADSDDSEFRQTGPPKRRKLTTPHSHPNGMPNGLPNGLGSDMPHPLNGGIPSLHSSSGPPAQLSL